MECSVVAFMWWCNSSAPSRQWIWHLPGLWVLHWSFHILPKDEKQRAQVTAGVFMGHSLGLNLDWQGNPYGNSRSSLRSPRTLCPRLQEVGESVAVSWGQVSEAAFPCPNLSYCLFPPHCDVSWFPWSTSPLELCPQKSAHEVLLLHENEFFQRTGLYSWPKKGNGNLGI